LGLKVALKQRKKLNLMLCLQGQNMSTEIELSHKTYLDTRIRRKLNVRGIELDEDFLSDLVVDYLNRYKDKPRPTISTAFEIYMNENLSAHRRKFRVNAQHYYRLFIEHFGDVPLDELRHSHITEYRDAQLARGLHPNSVRKHNNMLNAMVTMAFKHLDIDRLSPFRGLQIRGEMENMRPIPMIDRMLLLKVKEAMTKHLSTAHLIGLIQLNTGMRISEPSLARLDDLVLEHDIPHLWVRKNSLTDRKTKASIRAVPLVGISLVAAKKLYERAQWEKSEWLAPQYANEIGNTSCSATLNKSLKHLNFRSHMFRHAFIDRLKACNDIPLPLAESITGHGRNSTDFAKYGTVGYSLEQKLEVIKKIEI
jgi:integrase